ncbi:MAG: SIMPL domain-containing protein [Gemmatales bacterium]|nr:SIMPL domain-containing protein [Gemmatales bacterium]MDW8174846.1 SIMPL domain-containing protein [Gemmatales bacterium]
MYCRLLFLCMTGMTLVAWAWGQGTGNGPAGSPAPGSNVSENRARLTAKVEVHGVGTVRLPAEGVRVLCTLQLRMPTLKEVTAEDERRASRLEQGWRELKLGDMKIRLLEHQFHTVRMPDPNQPALDLQDLPVVGYAVVRVYQVEITQLPAEQLAEAATRAQKVALQHGAILGAWTLSNPFGQMVAAPGHIPAGSESAGPVAYFRRDTEEAYQQALKKAKENALKKVRALYGDPAPSRITLQEVNGALPDAIPEGTTPVSPVRVDGSSGPVTRLSSAVPEVEVVAVVRVVCEF